MTSFHHQPEAQHPKSPAIHNIAGRLPHLMARGHSDCRNECPLFGGNVQFELQQLRKRRISTRNATMLTQRMIPIDVLDRKTNFARP